MEYKIVKIKDKNYPSLLKEIYDPPKQLYVLGELKAKEEWPLAVVGTRKLTNYGKQVTERLAREVTRNGMTIISGMALGADGIAHRMAIEQGMRTIAVLGSGFDNIYPRAHQRLAQEIVKLGGAIISEYPPATEPFKGNFPARNRIVSGMSLGVLVTEAPIKSGALITARLAGEQGRNIFAVPGDITNKNSEGTNYLIKTGAQVVTGPKDIFRGLGAELSLIVNTTKSFETKEEEVLMKILAEKPTHIDDLIKKSNIKAEIIMSCLTNMEIRGVVKNLGNGEYANME